MEITPSMIYWITRATSIRGSLRALAALDGLLIVGLLLSVAVCSVSLDDEIREKGKVLESAIKKALIALALFILSNAFIPDSKDLAAMIVIPRIANNESVKQLGDNIVDLANQWVTELAPGEKTAHK